MTRACPLAIASLAASLVAAPALTAQHHPAAWAIGTAASLAAFRGSARDASGAEARPSQGIAVSTTIARRWKMWEAVAEVGYLPAHVEIVDDGLGIQDRSASLSRLRLAMLLGRRLTPLGSGSLHLRVGPTLDWWSLGGEDGRTALGARGELVLRVPLGTVELEHALGYGWSEGIFKADELPDGYRPRTLCTLTFGVGLHLRL